MKNEQLEYYKKYNISPEHQNIEDIEIHYARRNKLYRQCGMPEILFRDAEILEVGPGGGYNTLAFFHWNCKHVDLVEANPSGIREMRKLFTEKNISVDKYEIFEDLIEEYNTEHRYDIIIAEGFLANLYNQKEVLDKLKSLVKQNGIIVITCSSKVDFFIETIKRMVGVVLTRDISMYEEKVQYLTKLFKPQLEKLRGISKLPEDWVRDNILNPEINNEMEFSLSHAIQYFRDDFDILGTSPKMFTDYSWSKDIWYDYKKDYLEQFEKKRLSLIMANMPEVILPVDCANQLITSFEQIKELEAVFERTLENDKIHSILQIMAALDSLIEEYFPTEFTKVFSDIKELLLNICQSENISMENYPNLFAAFGRTQQYISFVKMVR